MGEESIYIKERNSNSKQENDNNSDDEMDDLDEVSPEGALLYLRYF